MEENEKGIAERISRDKEMTRGEKLSVVWQLSVPAILAQISSIIKIGRASCRERV